jgi:hypothetical protein
MTPIRRIACASFETPDIERLTDYYVNVIGLSLAAKEKDAVYLASTVQKGRSRALKGGLGRLRLRTATAGRGRILRAPCRPAAQEDAGGGKECEYE